MCANHCAPLPKCSSQPQLGKTGSSCAEILVLFGAEMGVGESGRLTVSLGNV